MPADVMTGLTYVGLGQPLTSKVGSAQARVALAALEQEVASAQQQQDRQAHSLREATSELQQLRDDKQSLQSDLQDKSCSITEWQAQLSAEREAAEALHIATAAERTSLQEQHDTQSIQLQSKFHNSVMCYQHSCCAYTKHSDDVAYDLCAAK